MHILQERHTIMLKKEKKIILDAIAIFFPPFWFQLKNRGESLRMNETCCTSKWLQPYDS